jgi:hypothetical protein
VQNLQAESPTVAHLVQMAQEHDVPILKVTETLIQFFYFLKAINNPIKLIG